MKPKDLIKKSLQEKIEPILLELGFIFSKSILKFSRKWNDFTHEINVSSSKWNAEDFIVQFHTSFGVSSKKYVQWYLDEYGEKPTNDSIASEVDWNLEGWDYPTYNSQFKSKFDITEETDRERVLEILLFNIINVGIPYLEKYSDWKVAAEKFVEENWFHSKACDFYLIDGNRAKAYESLKIGQKLSNNSFPNKPKAIKLRLKKHFDE